jgi:hypothetical protein
MIFLKADISGLKSKKDRPKKKAVKPAANSNGNASNSNQSQSQQSAKK